MKTPDQKLKAMKYIQHVSSGLILFCILVVFNSLAIGQPEYRIDTLPSGELMLTQEIILDAPLKKVWNAYTHAEAWRQWVAPHVEIDFRINGTIKSHYDPDAHIGDPGTIVIHILNYIPDRQITMQAEIAENFPEFVKGEGKNLYSIVDFKKLDAEKTRVTLFGIGYKNAPRWHELLQVFIQGNAMTLHNLKSFVEKKSFDH